MRSDVRGVLVLALITAGCHVESGDVLVRGSSTLYLSPVGSDDNPGTQALPWQHFERALPALGPGFTLVLEDGLYDGTTTGYLRAFCSATTIKNGTPDAPITVRALNERKAHLKGDGSGAPIELSACSNWILSGLYAEGTDFTGEMGDEPGSVVVLTNACNHVLLTRMVAAHPNRTVSASAYVVAHAAPGVVIEESEALDFHTYGFHAYDSMQPIFRRDYAHSRDTMDLPGVRPSLSPTNGDGGFLLTKSLGGIVENCVAEHVYDGFTIAASSFDAGGKVQPHDDQLLGDVANDVTHAGFVLESRCNNVKAPCNQGDQIVSNAVVKDDVSRGGALGVSVEGGVTLAIESTSIFDATDTGVAFALSMENLGLASSATARGTLVTAPGAAFGFHATGQVSWAFSRCNAYGPGMTFAPRDGHVMNGTETDPQLGACLVSVPAGSPFAPVPGGPAIGATLAFRYENGVLTATKLWDQATGAFPCGATIVGESDDPTISCAGVSTRLHVGADAGCAIP
jgi:hypothetical protein